ncbi:MAG: hypothetical protein HDR55_05025 [Treponema sp.]|nr:hypothetical protein [Treponema sp.]
MLIATKASLFFANDFTEQEFCHLLEDFKVVISRCGLSRFILTIVYEIAFVLLENAKESIPSPTFCQSISSGENGRSSLEVKGETVYVLLVVLQEKKNNNRKEIKKIKDL